MLGSARAAGARPPTSATGRGGGQGGGQGGGGGRQGGQAAASSSRIRSVPAAAAAAVAAAAADSAAVAAATPGRMCCPAAYNVALIVDGKTVETKPLRVSADPEVVLTDAQRKQLYDMAMEMHELQKRATEAATRSGPSTRGWAS